ncbi:MAG: methyltransferase domain-containing protein [Chloroflexi bacterium]|nr:methyltransferase domain-containing protein [Chloroflexota bacterium]
MLTRLWRVGFHLLYNQCAFTYARVSWAVSLGRWRAWQRSAMRFLPPPEAGLALELAHGTGDLQIDLQEAGYHTLALDLSPRMNRLAQKKLRRMGLGDNLVRGDATRLPLPDESLATVVCTFPTAFIFHPQTLNELQRVLQPGAPACIVVAGELHGRGPRRSLIALLYRATGQSKPLPDDRDLRSYFGEAGLLVEAPVVQLADSTAQLIILTKPPKPTLDFAAQSC